MRGQGAPRPATGEGDGEGDGRGRRHRARRWLAAAARVLVAVLGLALLAAAGGVFLVSQTVVGRETAARFVEDRLAGAVNGRVEVGPVTGGNLFTRARLARFRITAPDGDVFVSLQGITLEYNPLDFLRSRFVFQPVEIREGLVRLVQDTAGTWNFERLFGGAEEEADATPPVIALYDVRLGSGRVEVERPYTADAGSGRRRRAGAGGGPGQGGDEEIWRVRRGEGGVPVQEIAVDSLAARFPRLVLSHPETPLAVEIRSGSGTALAVTQPLALRDADLEMLFGDTVRVDVGRVRTLHSELRGDGWVASTEPVSFRFELDADPLGFEDLRWIPLPLPGSGGGPARLVLRSAGEDFAADVRDADVEVDGSRLRGGFTAVLRETPFLDDVEMELRPLRMALLRDLARQAAGGELPEGMARIRGSVEGTLRGRGPVDDFALEADLALRPAEAPSAPAGPGGVAAERAAPGVQGAAAGAKATGTAGPSRLRVRGRLGLVDRRVMRDLRLSLETFDLDWLTAFGAGTRIEGRLTGSLGLDGAADSAVAFQTDLTHRSGGSPASRVSGTGRIRPGSDTVPLELDVDLEVDPLALSVLQPYFPDLELTGTVRGPVSARGTLGDLQARAAVVTPRGRISFDGRFDLASEIRTYDARVTAENVQLTQWFRGGPYTDLQLRGSVAGRGTDPSTLEATLDLRILPSVVEGAAVDSSLLRLRFHDGLATVDTFAIRSDVGEVRGRGAFGLGEEQSGVLVLLVDAPDISEWNRWVVAGRNPVRPDTAVEDLFQELERRGPPEAGGPPSGLGDDGGAPPDTLAGSLTARGVVYGNVRDFTFGGQLRARSVGYGALGADSLVATMDAVRPEALDSLVVRTEGWGVRAPRVRFDSLVARVARLDPERHDVRLEARRDTTLAVEAAVRLVLGEAARTVHLDELELALGSRRLALSEPATVTYADSGLYVPSLRVRGTDGAGLTVEGRIPDRGTAEFTADLQALPLGDVARALLVTRDVGGRLGATVRVEGTADAPRIEAAVRVTEPHLDVARYGPMTWDLAYADRVTRMGSTIRSPDGRLLGTVEGTVRGDLSFRDVEDRFPEDPLDLTVRADSVPASLLELTMESVRRVGGHVAGAVRVQGSPGSLRLDGSARLVDGEALVPALGVGFTDVQGWTRLQGQTVRVDSLRLRSTGGGTGRISGTVTLDELTDPGLDLDLNARRLRGIDRRRTSIVLDGSGRLAGTYRGSRLTGSFHARNGDIQLEPYLRERSIVELTDPEALALIDTTMVAERRLVARMQNPFLQNMQMDLDLGVGPDLWLRSPSMDVEVAGDVRIRMARAERTLNVFGPLRLVRGVYRVAAGPYSRELQIEQGTIEFVGTPGVNPNLDVTAVYRTRGTMGPLVIRARVTGTLLEKRLALSSQPPISESDQFCYLLLGSGCVAATGALGGGTGGLTSSFQQQLLGSVGGQLFSSLLVEDAWLDYLNVSQAGYVSAADGGFRTGAGLLAGTEVEIGKYLGPSLFVTVSKNLGTSEPPGLTLQWDFARGWTLQGRSESRLGRFGLPTLSSSLELDRLWGLFVFREWGF